jgi:hypothetical protein
MGKTALAIKAADLFRAEFPGGRVFVSARNNPGFGLQSLFLAMDDALGTQLRHQDPEVRPGLARARLCEKSWQKHRTFGQFEVESWNSLCQSRKLRQI